MILKVVSLLKFISCHYNGMVILMHLIIKLHFHIIKIFFRIKLLGYSVKI